MGAKAYRFSVEWARIEPEPGRFDDEAIARYRHMLEVLRGHGIEPFVTLLHFTHPTWFHETAPWHEPKSVEHFEAFATKVADGVGDLVRYWTIINEPMVWLVAAYFGGAIPPGIKSLRTLSEALFNLVRAHARVARVLKARGDAKIGVANNMIRFAPSKTWNPLDGAAARYIARAYNHAFLKAATSGVAQLGLLPGIRLRAEIEEAKNSLDFIGVNYYSRMFVDVRPFGKEKVSVFYEDRSNNGVSDLGWEIFPEGLKASLLEASRYGLPLYVTENGMDDRDDSRRSAYLYDHLQAVLQANAEGANVRGYLHWSLLDNFEWLEGYGPRFGLLSVDYADQTRTATKAVEVYSEIIRTRRLPDRRPEWTKKPGSGRTYLP